MVGDFVTKPLQGVQFHKFRDQIMGVVPMKFDLMMKKPSSGNQDKKKPSSGKKDTQKTDKKGLVSREATPQECVGENVKCGRQQERPKHVQRTDGIRKMSG